MEENKINEKLEEILNLLNTVFKGECLDLNHYCAIGKTREPDYHLVKLIKAKILESGIADICDGERQPDHKIMITAKGIEIYNNGGWIKYKFEILSENEKNDYLLNEILKETGIPINKDNSYLLDNIESLLEDGLLKEESQNYYKLTKPGKNAIKLGGYENWYNLQNPTQNKNKMLSNSEIIQEYFNFLYDKKDSLPIFLNKENLEIGIEKEIEIYNEIKSLPYIELLIDRSIPHKDGLIPFFELSPPAKHYIKEFGSLENWFDNQNVKNVMNITNEKSLDNNIKKIFISHSSNDTEIVDILIDLIELIGIPHESIFYSSKKGYGVPLGMDFLHKIREELKGDVFVLYIISDNFFDSAVCLCEMGAAWIMSANYIPILIPPFDYNKMKGVIPSSVIRMEINDESDYNLLKEELEKYFDLSPKNQNRWEQKRNKFINQINEILAKNRLIVENSIVQKLKLLNENSLLEHFFEKYSSTGFPKLEKIKDEIHEEVIQITGEYNKDEVDLTILPPFQNSKKIDITYKIDKRLTFYVLVALSGITESLNRNVWIRYDHEVRLPEKFLVGMVELGYPISNNSLNNDNYLIGILDIENGIKNTFGKENYKYAGLIKFRIRGSGKIKNLNFY